VRFLLLFAALVPAAFAASDLLLVNGTVIPAPDQPALRDTAILLHDGRIAAIGPRDQLAIPAGTEVMDCTGRFITAGFWNCHVHLTQPDLFGARHVPVAQLEGTLTAMFSRWGFTTVFDLASPLENTIALRERIEAGEVRGPRILTTGEAIWSQVPVYIPAHIAAGNPRMSPVATPEEVVHRIGEHARRGVDGIKLFTGSLQAQGAVANLDAGLVRAAVAEAERRHLPVFAHPQNAAGVEAALAGGVAILAHTAPAASAWTPEQASRLRDARVALIPSLTLFRIEGQRVQLPAALQEQWRANTVGQVRAFHAAGGGILFGTDAGYITHYDTAEEYQLLASAGLDAAAILRSLTTVPAARFGRAERSGRVAAGFDADLVVLDADPIKDVTAFSRVRATLRGGRLFFESASTDGSR
jgi:imidazolonepropionase-like amidohydrolase